MSNKYSSRQTCSSATECLESETKHWLHSSLNRLLKDSEWSTMPTLPLTYLLRSRSHTPTSRTRSGMIRQWWSSKCVVLKSSPAPNLSCPTNGQSRITTWTSTWNCLDSPSLRPSDFITNASLVYLLSDKLNNSNIEMSAVSTRLYFLVFLAVYSCYWIVRKLSVIPNLGIEYHRSTG